MLIIDFETRSRVNLKTAGAYNYANDASTEILCLGWADSTGEHDAGVTFEPDNIPVWITKYIRDGNFIGAFNAQFDRLIWEALMHPDLQVPLAQWYCVAAQVRVNALPTQLNNCGKVIYGKYKKDARGPQLIRQLSIPQKNGRFFESDILLKEMGEYCVQDCKLTADVYNDSRKLTPSEYNDWLNCEQINDDGVRVDIPLAESAVKYAEQETAAMGDRLVSLTGGEVTRHTQSARLKKWLNKNMPLDARELTMYTKKGEPKRKQSLDKQRRKLLLEADTEGVILLPAAVRDVIDIVDVANMSGVTKFKGMLNRADPDDDRIRGAYVYAGATQTIRFTSHGLQLHNFARDCFTPDAAEDMRAKIMDFQTIPEPMKTLSKMLRPAIIPERGNLFVVGDWSGIEACALPWLADDPRAAPRLNVLADPEQDMYVITQERLGLQNRQMGKVVELSMGYGGGAGAFNAMAANYGVSLPEHKVKKIVEDWRRENQWAVDFWDSLLRAAKMAILNYGFEYAAGRVKYCFYPELLGGTLICTLPNEQMIQYPYARLEDVETPYGVKSAITAMKASWKPAAGETEWPRIQLWRGLLAENVTQAVCAQLLCEAVDDLIEHDWPVIAHVHDEIILEVGSLEADGAKEVLREFMETVPPWAKGMPLIAEPKIMRRYGK